MKKSFNNKLNHILHTIIHVIEYTIALLTLLVIAILLGIEVFKMFSNGDYFLASEAHTYLNSMLTIVIGLEFARMLINLTPANTIEVLIVAMARQVIVDHSSYIGNIVSIVCLALLFAIRKFLIPTRENPRNLFKIKRDQEATTEVSEDAESEH